jgi:hypothetical protein
MIRKHRVIREASIVGPGTFTFDIETEQFKNLLVTWCTSDDSLIGPTSLLAFPTNSKRANLALSNYPGIPTLAAIGGNAYAGIGPDCNVAVPLASMITIGAILPNTCQVSIRIEGDEEDNILESPLDREKARA